MNSFLSNEKRKKLDLKHYIIAKEKMAYFNENIFMNYIN